MWRGKAASDSSARDSPLVPGGPCAPESASSSSGKAPSKTLSSKSPSCRASAVAGEPSLSSPPDADALGVLVLLSLPPLSLPPLSPLPPVPPVPGGELLPLPPVGSDESSVKEASKLLLKKPLTSTTAACFAASMSSSSNLTSLDLHRVTERACTATGHTSRATLSVGNLLGHISRASTAMRPQRETSSRRDFPDPMNGSMHLIIAFSPTTSLGSRGFNIEVSACHLMPCFTTARNSSRAASARNAHSAAASSARLPGNRRCIGRPRSRSGRARHWVFSWPQ